MADAIRFSLLLGLAACGSRTGLREEAPQSDARALYLLWTHEDCGDYLRELGYLALKQNGDLAYTRLGDSFVEVAPDYGFSFEVTDDGHGRSVKAFMTVLTLPELEKIGTIEAAFSDDFDQTSALSGCIVEVAPDRAMSFGVPILVFDPSRARKLREIDTSDVPDLSLGTYCVGGRDVIATWALFTYGRNDWGEGLLLTDPETETVRDGDPNQPGTNPFPTVVTRVWPESKPFRQGRFLYLSDGVQLERFDLERRESDGIVLSTDHGNMLQPRAVLEDGDWVAGVGAEVVRIHPDTMEVTALDEFDLHVPLGAVDFLWRGDFASAPDGNFVFFGHLNDSPQGAATLRDGRTGAVLAQLLLPFTDGCVAWRTIARIDH